MLISAIHIISWVAKPRLYLLTYSASCASALVDAEVANLEEQKTQDYATPEPDDEAETLENIDDPNVSNIKGRQASLLHNFGGLLPMSLPS